MRMESCVEHDDMEISLVNARVELNPRRVTPSGFQNRFVAPCYKRFTPSGLMGSLK